MSHPFRWALAPHVHAAVDAGNLVLLDIEADAYFCLPGLAEGFPQGPLAGGLSDLSASLLGELAGAKLIHQTTGPDRAPFEVTTPRRDLAGAVSDRIRARDAWDLAAAWSGLAPRFYRRPFSEVIDRARGRKAGVDGEGRAGEVEARAVLFNSLLPWSPVQGACLLQSAWLITFLGQAGLAADWMFGVRTWPFSAHCWVQLGEVVLNDTVERVAPYRAILKV